VVGLSHHSAPLVVRERMAFDIDRWRQTAPPALPGVLLSTCNRVEVYAWAGGRPSSAVRALQRGLARAAGCRYEDLAPHLYASTGRDAVLHLVRVAAGLDSLVLGEDQIRGQMREALRQAEAAWPLPAPLRGAFQRASESARRVRASTRLAHQPSIATAGVHVAQRVLGEPLAGRAVVVLGAGVIARAAVEDLRAAGAQVTVLNRTPEHAQDLHGVRVAGLDSLAGALEDAVLVVAATASRQPVVQAKDVQRALDRRSGRLPLVLLDIALPRDVEPSVRTLDGARLIDLDDLERECPLDVHARRAEVERAEALAAEEASRLADWLRTRAVSPAIVELRGFAESIRAAELRRSAARLKDLTPEQAAAVDALTAGIVNKLLHGPTVALRDAAASPRGLRRTHSRILRVLRPERGRTA
jgi:glutamyl-tRNA reductase